MATVIDSLIVKLGLDSGEFKKASKESKKEIRSLREETARARKAAKSEEKDAEEANKRRKEAFDQAKKSAIQFIAIVTAGRGAMDFTKYIINSGAQLDRMSRNLGVSADKLSRWQGAVRQTGGTAEGALNTFKALNSSLTELKLTGTSSILPLVQMLGVSLGENGKARELDDIIMDIGDALKKMPREDAYNIAQQMGIDEGMVELLLKSKAEIGNLLKAQKGFSDADAKAAREAQENWEKTKLEIERTTQQIVIKLLPAIQKIAESFAATANVIVPLIVKGVEGFNALNDATNGWVLTLGLAAVAIKSLSWLLGIGGGGLLGGVAALAKFGLLGAAGAGGWAIGSKINEKLSGTKTGDAIGEGIAKTLAFFGNKNAQEALKANNPGAVANAPVSDLIGGAESANKLPKGILKSIVTQETGNRREFLDDPAKYHYEKDANGKRKSSAFGPYGILDSTARDPGYGVKPLQNKSLQEQTRFAAEYLAARIRASGGDVRKALAGYGEGGKYANEVMGRMDGGMTGLMTSGNSSSSQVAIGEIKVYTQATNAEGIVKDMRAEIVRQSDTGMR